MPRISDLREKHFNKLRLGLIGLLSLLDLFGFCFCAYYNIVRNVFSLANCLLDMTCLIFLTLLFAFSSDGEAKAGKKQRYFELLVVIDFVMTFFSLLGSAVMFIPGYDLCIKIFDAISVSFLSLLCLVIWLYQKEYSQRKKLVRAEMILIFGMTAAYIAITVVNVFYPILYAVDKNGSYVYSDFDMITTVFGFVYFVLLYINILFAGCPLKKKLSLASCEIAPAVGLIIFIVAGLFNWNVYLPAIIDLSFLIPLYIIFFNVHIEQKKEMLRQEAEQTELQAAVMVSMIQPHFLYNSLSVISALCDENPELAGKATIDFAEYLRENMNCMDFKNPIPFENEMDHIRKYIALEKLRFPDKLKVEYDIECTGFAIPALSVQPLVDNAVKHGVCKSRGGGTVRIAAHEGEYSYTVTVEDDGAGFDPTRVPDDGKKHIGIESARTRIERMTGGTLSIRSAVGQGTTATIEIPKGGVTQ